MPKNIIFPHQDCIRYNLQNFQTIFTLSSEQFKVFFILTVCCKVAKSNARKGSRIVGIRSGLFIFLFICSFYI